MKKISIYYLPFRRCHFSELTFYYIKKIRDDLKNLIELNILTDDYTPFNNNYDWKPQVQELKAANIDCNLVQLTTYLSKLEYGIERGSEYSIKLDEDCFINDSTWNYFLDNLHLLDNPENLILSPVLSNGIPSIEYFMEDFFGEEDRQKLEKTFLKLRFKNIWGSDYAMLNKYTKNSKSWNPEEYYDHVSKLPYYYRGIHPVRLSKESQLLLMDLVLKNLDRFNNSGNYSVIDGSGRPYLCNTLFAIKTDRYKQVIEKIKRKEIFSDGFDEVPINLYRQYNGLKMLFIKNGFAIHTTYNTVPIFKEELKFYDELKKRLIIKD